MNQYILLLKRFDPLLYVLLTCFLSGYFFEKIANTELMGYVQILLFAMLLLYIPGYLFFYKKRSFLNYLLILLLILTAYYFGYVSIDNSTMLKEVAFCSLCCLPFYLDKKNKFIPFCIISIIAILLNYYENRNFILTQNPESYGGGGIALSVLPIGLYLLRDKKIAYSVIWAILAFILVLTTIKRGAIVSCFGSIITYFGYRMMSLRGRKVWNLLIFIIVGILLYVVFFRFVNSSDIFQSRFEATLGGYTSNRDYIYTSLINHFINSPLSVQIFGNGFNSCWSIAGNVAHNDWLELLTDTGIIGCLFYFLALITLIRSAFKLSKINDRAILLCICLIWVVESMVSMFIFATNSMIYFILIGYIFGNEDRKILCKVKK